MNSENRGIHSTGVSPRVWVVLAALCVVNVAAHLLVMPSLPAQIPTHWGASGTVNGWAPVGWPRYLVRCPWCFSLCSM